MHFLCRSVASNAQPILSNITSMPNQSNEHEAPSSRSSGDVSPAKPMECPAAPSFPARHSRPDKIIVSGGFHSMSLNETTRQVLRLVEERSGLPVHVEPDPNLPGTLLATVTMARGRVPLHRVVYRPNSATPPDYLICKQAGFILRLFATPPESRKDFAGTAAANVAVERLVKEHPVAQMLPPAALPQFVQMLRDGLLQHLRSIPVGMRVDRWLASEFPELKELQRQAVQQQLQDAVLTLAPQHRQSTPRLIFDATQGISAAFAAFWSQRLEQSQLTLPYKATGHLEAGASLLAIWEAVPDLPENDSQLVDRWAEWFGIADWCQWVPYSAPK